MKLKALIPKETILMALDNVRAHKFRSFLTTLGIVIGVVVVIIVASILTGMRNNVVAFVEEYGTNNIFAFHLSTGPHFGQRDRREYQRKPLTPENGETIKAQAPTIEDVANVGFIWRLDTTIVYDGEKYRRGNVQGVSANYVNITNLSISDGRFISEDDDTRRRDVMVIGINVADALFPKKANVAGTQVTMGGRPFEVIGVLDKRKGGFFGENEDDDAVLIPFRTARKIAPASDYMMLIMKARPGQLKTALNEVEEVLRRERGVRFNQDNDFDLSTADKFVEQFDSITAVVGLIAIAISGVGLLVGGIGVMNIMLVSVTERTQEIGVRKAIGAKRRDIVNQFLFEAITLTSLGGALGILLAIGSSQLLMLLVPELPASIPLWAVIAGITVSTAVGLIFGVWPARKAARLDPVEALRYE